VVIAILSIFSSECHKFLITNAQGPQQLVTHRTLRHAGISYFEMGLQSLLQLSTLTNALLIPGLSKPGCSNEAIQRIAVTGKTADEQDCVVPNADVKRPRPQPGVQKKDSRL
jgi:hypothetical protein